MPDIQFASFESVFLFLPHFHYRKTKNQCQYEKSTEQKKRHKFVSLCAFDVILIILRCYLWKGSLGYPLLSLLQPLVTMFLGNIMANVPSVGKRLITPKEPLHIEYNSNENACQPPYHNKHCASRN